MSETFETCPDCAGSGHIFKPVSDTNLTFVEHCETCRGTGRVPVHETPEPTVADERRRGFYTGENT